MSVLSAILVGALWCGKVKETPGVVPQAFIDNWEIVSNTAGAIETAFLATSAFAQEWRIALDVEKSWCWTLNFSNDETRLCDLGLARRSAAKDLGAVIKYGKNMSNRPLQNRVTEGIARLLRLADLPLSKADKVNVILANAFPTAFFGCEITLLGQNHFKAVRSAVVNVMLRRHRRASPEGACLAFGKGDLDPFVWTVLTVLRQCRSFFATRDPEWQAFVEMTQAPFTAKTKVYGPAGVLKRYLQVMSLSVEVDGTIVFRNQARLHLLRCCYAELRNAVCEAWDDTVLARLRQRSGAEDLESLDSSATRYVLDQMPDPSYRQAAVMHLAGGFPTRIHLTHSDGGNDKCTTCGERDTMAHRVKVCPKYSHVRDQFPALVTLSDAQATLPWLPRIAEACAFRVRRKPSWCVCILMAVPSIQRCLR